jgi:hypothetical protein
VDGVVWSAPDTPDRRFPRVVKNRAHKFPTKKMPVSVN